jgi:integrase
VSGNPATPDAVVPGPATRGLRLGPRGRSPGGRLRAARRRRPVDRMLPGPRSGGPRAPSLGHSGPGCTRRARDQRSTHRGRARRLPSSSWTAGPWTSFGTRRSFSATSTAATGTRSDSPATSQVRCFQARKALGEDLLPVIRLHHLRHTHATLLLADGVPVKAVSERLGHASATITLTAYQHAHPGTGRPAPSRPAGC